MLREDAVAGEEAEEALEVAGIVGGGGEAVAAAAKGLEDLGGGEGGVEAVLPDGGGDVEADDSGEGHGDAYHVGQFHDR